MITELRFWLLAACTRVLTVTGSFTLCRGPTERWGLVHSLQSTCTKELARSRDTFLARGMSDVHGQGFRGNSRRRGHGPLVYGCRITLAEEGKEVSWLVGLCMVCIRLWFLAATYS